MLHSLDSVSYVERTIELYRQSSCFCIVNLVRYGASSFLVAEYVVLWYHKVVVAESAACPPVWYCQ